MDADKVFRIMVAEYVEDDGGVIMVKRIVNDEILDTDDYYTLINLIRMARDFGLSVLDKLQDIYFDFRPPEFVLDFAYATFDNVVFENE